MRTVGSVDIGKGMDLADVIYCFHRCVHGHGEELPDTFALLEDAAGSGQVTRVIIGKGIVQLSDRTIFGLLAVAILSSHNILQKVPDEYHLTYGGSKLIINDWWGRTDDFVSLTNEQRMPLVKLDFGEWMSP